MKTSLLYGEKEVAYIINDNASLQNKIRIHVHPNGLVEVEVPSQKALPDIQNAVLKRARWIVQKLDEVATLKKHALQREYISGETHFYLGRRYQLKVSEECGKPSKVAIKGGYLHVQLPYKEPAAIKRRLRKWYYRKAEQYFQKRLNDIVTDILWLQKTPPIKLIPMKTQWGSYSPQGQINLNPMLIKATRESIDYVIIHELCHLQEHNHSKKFWALLQKELPNWQHIKNRLDGMAELLLAE